MRTINLDPLSFYASPEEKKFILLRSETADSDEFLSSMALPKIQGEISSSIPGIWGTLGYKNDQPIDWEGRLEISNEGNHDFVSGSAIMEDVELLQTLYPTLLLDEHNVTERFINFNKLEIPFPEVFSYENIPRLRLDIFLRADEGAIAFYQYQQDNNEDADIEYILPQPTDKEHSINKRDRLTYLFNVIPKKQYESIDGVPNRFLLGAENNLNDFIVKILIFKRTFKHNDSENYVPATSDELVEIVEKQLEDVSGGLFVKKPKVLIFKKDKNKFKQAKKGEIVKTKKTLLLIHGTFASTKGSFGKLYGDKNRTWLQSLMDNNPKYEQIIAYDHPTLFWDADKNIRNLIFILEGLGVSGFIEPIDIIGTSQGGVLSQYFANLTPNKFKIGKVALVASANGVDYLSLLNHTTDGLNILKKVLKLFGQPGIITAIVQHSLDWIINRGGMQIITPGHEKLTSIMYNRPFNNETRYLPLVSTFTPKVFEDSGLFNFFNRRKEKRGKNLDKVIDLILGENNDWVVGTKNQFKVPAEYVSIEGYNVAKYRSHMFHALHGRLIELEDVQEEIEFFFSNPPTLRDSINSGSMDYFDGHLHLFGRNIISARVLLMLLGDFIDYFTGNYQSTPIDVNENLRPKPHDKTNIWKVIQNIFKYYLFNNDAHQMIHDIEEDYYKKDSGVYRYIPLMFDLEMTFRNAYDGDPTALNLAGEIGENFRNQYIEFYNELEKFIDEADSGNYSSFAGSQIEREQSVHFLKIAKHIMKGLDIINFNLNEDLEQGYNKQLDEMKELKIQYGGDIFPFLATDPRRPGMGELLKEHILVKKTFKGVKIYTPNGYSPTDVHLYNHGDLANEDTTMVDGQYLYEWCISNDIPIMAHNSDSGFATFTENLEVWGDVLDAQNNPEFVDKDYITFNNVFFRDRGIKPDQVIKERAYKLNHPKLWAKVLAKYNNLKICLAHFGGGNPQWRKEIADLMVNYPNVYTDLSCIRKLDILKDIKQNYFDTNTDEAYKIRSKIMYGSDYFLNLLSDIEFGTYYQNFIDVFSEEELKFMSNDVPKRFLGIG